MDRVLTGLAVSPGVATGPVHILLGAQGIAETPAGSILVAPSTDPGWTPLFPRLAGMILETGGQLSHGAVVAREYGLPTVAGIAGATSLLQQGEIVTVNGSTGIIVRQNAHPGGSQPAPEAEHTTLHEEAGSNV